MSASRRIIACMAIAAGSAAIALLVHSAGWTQRLEHATWDWRQRVLATPAPAELPIRLILIDQPSLDWAAAQAGSPWPWPREFYAAIIDFCRTGGAKAIAFDLFFSEPSMFGADDDDRLAAALRGGGPTALALPQGPRLSTPSTWNEEIQASRYFVGGFDAWRAQHPEADLDMNSVVMSLPAIANSVTALGHVRGDQDADSIVRRATPLLIFDGQTVPLLALAAHLVASPADALRIENDVLLAGAHRVPLDPDGSAILRYRHATNRDGVDRMYPAFSAAGVINAQLAAQSGQTPAIAPDEFRDCVVFIGPSAAGTYDLKPTPMNKAGPGVEVHATFLDNLLNDGFLQRPRDAWVWLFTLALAIGGTFAARESKRAWQVLGAIALVLPLPWIVGFLAFGRGVMWPIVAPELAVILALSGGVIVNYAVEGRQRRFIHRSFQHYLSPTVIEQIVRDPTRLRLGGERREVTVFFADIAGFTSIAERLDAQQLAQLLNDYLTEMTDIILEESGTIDKYVGDAIVAFWNAPLEQPDHALRAARAAIRCQDALANRREEFRRRIGSDLRMRIGINTGEANVGNFGSRGRFDYTVMGHAVNVASRLEGANRYFGTGTLIAEETWRRLGGTVTGREVGRLRVVGAVEPVRAYQLLAADDLQGMGEAGIEAFAQAMKRLEAGDLAGAAEAFSRLAPRDALSRAYAERLQAGTADGAEPWDGVWALAGK